MQSDIFRLPKALPRRRNHAREYMSATPRWKPDANARAAGVLSVISLASIAAGAINFTAAATVGRGSAENLAFFVAVGAAQLVWGAVALARTSRWLLALGAAGNLLVVATWVLSRTVGLPAGVDAGIILPVGFADALATALEVVIVGGAAVLMVRGWVPARSAARAPGVTIAAAVVVGGLALGGVLGQAGAIGSSSTGSGGGANGSVSSGSGGGGIYGGGTNGGGTSGGGTSGGGSSGGGAYGY